VNALRAFKDAKRVAGMGYGIFGRTSGERQSNQPERTSRSPTMAMAIRRARALDRADRGLALPQKARMCNPCARNEPSPLSQERQIFARQAAPGGRWPDVMDGGASPHSISL